MGRLGGYGFESDETTVEMKSGAGEYDDGDGGPETNTK